MGSPPQNLDFVDIERDPRHNMMDPYSQEILMRVDSKHVLKKAYLLGL